MMGITGNLKLNAKVIIIIRLIKNLQPENMHENLKSVPPTANLHTGRRSRVAD